MGRSKLQRTVGIAVLAGALVFIGGCANAQTTTSSAVRVSGPHLQLWLDHNFTSASLSHTNGCFFMTTGAANARTQFLSCPDGWSDTLKGSSRVVGDTLCYTFPYPDRPLAEQCREWYWVGDHKVEMRANGVVFSTGYILSVVPIPGK
ncbi:MAG: hypothetical protein Q8K96_13555 [Rubrivivax sp.]|nr:hypothetical protein [Rubrivivax sp.]